MLCLHFTKHKTDYLGVEMTWRPHYVLDDRGILVFIIFPFPEVTPVLGLVQPSIQFGTRGFVGV